MFDELTPVDIQKMQQEIDRRIKMRDDYHEDIVMARSYGDLSENSEYHEAKRKKGQNEGRIAYLRRVIKTANIIDVKSKDDEIGFFDKVLVYFEDEGEAETITISTTMRIDATNGVISNKSPLGKAMFGHKVGERLKVVLEDGSFYFIVIKSIKKGCDDDTIPLNAY